MRTYDVQELLRQQKNSIIEHILTIILAIILGLCSSMIFDGIINDQPLNSLWLPSIIIIILLFVVLIPVFIDKNLIKVKEELITALFCLDLGKDLKLIPFEEYPFSVQTEYDWRSLVRADDKITEKFKKAHENSMNYNEGFDYILITDLLQYFILRNISSYSRKKPNLLKFEPIARNIIERKFLEFLNYSTKYRISELLNNFNIIHKKYIKLDKINTLKLFIHGIPLVCLPKEVQNNLFITTLHRKQAEYEKIIIETGAIGKGENISYYSYFPLELNFPDYISIKFEGSNDSRINKIILTRKKVGKLIIDFHDRWGYSSIRALSLTLGRPGNRDRNFEEIFFEISADLYIRKYAYFPLIGGGEEKTDEFFSWANELIEKLKESCDWDYYQQNITRNTLAKIKNNLDYHIRESNIEHYYNFSDNEEGEIKKLLRLLLNPGFEYRKIAFENIEKFKDHIPADQLEHVILRILRLFKYPDGSTQNLATKALECFLTDIPNTLYEKVVKESLELTNSQYDNVKFRSLKNLEKLYMSITDEKLKEKIENRIISVYSSKDENITLLHYHAIINHFYPCIDPIKKDKFEEKFIQIIRSQDKDSIDSSFIFFTFVIELISEKKVKEVFDLSSQIRIYELQVQSIENYLSFLASISKVVSSESLENSLLEPIIRHFKILDSFIVSEHWNIKNKSKIIKKLYVIKPFLNLLRADQKEVIYTHLILLLLTTQDKDLKFNSLDTICSIADTFPGRENDIARILLENVDPKYEKIDIAFSVMSALENIKSKITDQVLMENASTFIQSIKNRDD
ncbi:hypothetical protein [Methanosarcina barkeri]|uniref:Uncharacterized protein n=1 Tax=Methanosarcina barkeri CM1 TaxID=796385 RepID=A0A0G3CJT1_METBA|nr:hypothetical protein [Methanosarcina barkeri]AKJ40148.1 hypothetical protein MCM1_3161 [Methanosarcina barkeri CM1]